MARAEPGVAGFGRLIAASAAMRRVLRLLPRLASSTSTVLIEGETGTGKSCVARALHEEGARAAQPFLVVDCGALPGALIEGELFGHEKGAFTGAHTARPGAFEAAHGGTVFLDEIGELPLELQPKLLRVLEDRVVRRLGGGSDVEVDVRILAATQRDLGREVARQRFREDLFYRLDVVRLRVPALRERPEDVALLATRFYRHFSGDEAGIPPAGMVAALMRHTWPGNVRELRSAVERAILLETVDGSAACDRRAAPACIDHSIDHRFRDGESFVDAKQRIIAAWEEHYVADLLRRFDGNMSRAARAAGMDRTHLRRVIDRRRLRVRPS